jgi:hypothetical protein
MKPTPPATTDVERFYHFVHTHAHGKANAITARNLGEALSLGASGDRKLRALVHAANESGLLIVADDSGYFEPDTPEECDESVGRLKSQAAEMLERARRIEALKVQHFYSTQMGMFL